MAEEDSPPRDTGKAARARNDSPQEIQPVHQNNEELPMSRVSGQLSFRVGLILFREPTRPMEVPLISLRIISCW